MIYAVVCPKVYKGGIYLRYLTTDKDKADEWAKQQTTSRENVRALDEQNNSHVIKHHVVELPFEANDMEWTISQHHFQPFEEIEEEIKLKKEENRITAMGKVSAMLEDKYGPVSQEAKKEVEELLKKGILTTGVT